MEETIRLKDREIQDIKDSLSNILQAIRDLAQEINRFCSPEGSYQLKDSRVNQADTIENCNQPQRIQEK